MSVSPNGTVRIGVDVGGTFTDVVVADESTGELISLKVPTTPDNLLEGIFRGLAKAAGRWSESAPDLLKRASSFVHGTTVCTNLMVQRAGAKVGLIATEGFRDSLALRRGARESVWDMRTPNPPDLVPRHLRVGVRERMDCFGEPLVPLYEESVEDALTHLKAHGVEAVAVCLFNAYADGRHEVAVKERAGAVMPGVPVLLSSDVLPVAGEYERASTTAIHAYVAPGAASYLNALDAELKSRGLRAKPLIIQGNGGVLDPERSVRRPGMLVLSGPAAATAAGFQYGKAVGDLNLLILDMGGTSCDLSVVVNGRIPTADVVEVEGYHLATPSLEVKTIGTGGGTIAFVDPGGMLCVGPRGSGADPGPVCYGRGGEEPTVTDANLILGRLGTDDFAGGEISIDRERAEAVIRQKIAEPLGLSPIEAARAIVRIANQNMISALEMISLEKGRDPRDFTLIAAGGAGPLHAGALAEALGIRRVYVPRQAAVFSALGLLHADLRQDYVQSFNGDLATAPPEELKGVFRRLTASAREEFLEMGVRAEDVEMELEADLRYRGQHWSIPVTLPALESPDPLGVLAAAFHERHEALYGHQDPSGVIDVLSLRVIAIARTPALAGGSRADARAVSSAGSADRREVSLDAPGPPVSAAVVKGPALKPGTRLSGPLLIEEPATTLWVAPGDAVEVDAYGNYLLLKEKG